MTAGTVTTIIPVFNQPAHLRDAVACVLAQAHRSIEITVVDVCSSDHTPEVAEALGRLPHCGLARSAALNAQQRARTAG